ncbi:MAG: hypothetical protein JW891_09670 [Candidatus Lokiarchaeota archaeon]|nr:hypothetical protein [Candidatus Lokiarchaeota archaeon]
MSKKLTAFVIIGIIAAISISVPVYFTFFSPIGTNINTGTNPDSNPDSDPNPNPNPNPLPADLIFDHKDLNINNIPESWIEAAKEIKFHYAHTSHGGQIINGLSYVQSDNALFNYSRGFNNLPLEANTFCMYDGNDYWSGPDTDTYIEPPMYWHSPDGIKHTYDVIDDNPSITLSMWCWCCQVSYYPQAQILEYLDQLNEFEQNYSSRGVRFIYMTGNADDGDYPEGTPAEGTNQDPEAGYQRYVNNELIRNYCEENDKILFDFADIECWLYHENGTAYDHSTYDYGTGDDTVVVPKRHWQYSNLDETAHTTQLNCKNKAKVFWSMLATIAGWDGS